VTSLQDHLESMGGAGLGIVLKIETVRGFERLPEMLLAAMPLSASASWWRAVTSPSSADLNDFRSARGDLWLCEAAMFRRFGRRRSSINWPERPTVTG